MGRIEIQREDYLRIVGDVLNGQFPQVLEAAQTHDKFCREYSNDEGATCTFGNYVVHSGRAVLNDTVGIREHANRVADTSENGNHLLFVIPSKVVEHLEEKYPWIDVQWEDTVHIVD